MSALRWRSAAAKTSAAKMKSAAIAAAICYNKAKNG